MAHTPASSRNRAWHTAAARGLCAVALGASVVTSAVAQQAANAPLREATVGDLVEQLLDRADRAYNYKKTAPPDTKTHLCADQPVEGSANGAAAATRLGVVMMPPVPYAGGDGPKVDLAVQFADGRDLIEPAGEKLLMTLRKALDDPAIATSRIAIAGHASASGSPGETPMVPCARALAVRQFLIARGVNPARLTAYGFGSSRLLASHASNPNADIHRRVEIRRAACDVGQRGAGTGTAAAGAC